MERPGQRRLAAGRLRGDLGLRTRRHPGGGRRSGTPAGGRGLGPAGAGQAGRPRPAATGRVDYLGTRGAARRLGRTEPPGRPLRPRVVHRALGPHRRSGARLVRLRCGVPVGAHRPRVGLGRRLGDADRTQSGRRRLRPAVDQVQRGRVRGQPRRRTIQPRPTGRHSRTRRDRRAPASGGRPPADRPPGGQDQLLFGRGGRGAPDAHRRPGQCPDDRSSRGQAGRSRSAHPELPADRAADNCAGHDQLHRGALVRRHRRRGQPEPERCPAERATKRAAGRPGGPVRADSGGEGRALCPGRHPRPASGPGRVGRVGRADRATGLRVEVRTSAAGREDPRGQRPGSAGAAGRARPCRRASSPPSSRRPMPAGAPCWR